MKTKCPKCGSTEYTELAPNFVQCDAYGCFECWELEE